MRHYFILTIPLIVCTGNNGPRPIEHTIRHVRTQPRSIVFPYNPNKSVSDSLVHLGFCLNVWRDIDKYSHTLVDFKEMNVRCCETSTKPDGNCSVTK